MPTKKDEVAPATPAPSTAGDGYCVKCKAKRTIKDAHEVSTNGRRMLKGTCPECGTTMTRILGKA